MDYIQLRFNGPVLNVYSASHKVLKNQASWAWGQPGYRDALCSLISHQVKNAQIAPESLSFTFDDDSVWSMSIRDEDYRGPEAFEFTDKTRNLRVVV